MGNILLILAVIGIFVYIYFIIKKIDHFINEQRGSVHSRSEVKEPSCVMLSEDVSEEKIVEELKDFRRKHIQTRVIILGSRKNLEDTTDSLNEEQKCS